MRPIPGYEGRYSATPDGEIYSHATGEVRKSFLMNAGYLMLTLSKNGRKRSITVHKLVALAYLGERPPGDIHVNHKDGNKLNNRPENLEYVTRSKNCQHAVRNGLTAVPGRKGDIFPLRVLGRLAMGWRIKDIAASLDVSPHTISRIKYGHTYADVTGIRQGVAS